MKTKRDYPYLFTKMLVNNRDKLIRLPLGIPLLIFITPILYELMRLNLFFLRDWIIINKYYTGTIAQMFLGPGRMELWGEFGALLIMLTLFLALIKIGLWNRVFPMLVLEKGNTRNEELRVYWYTGNYFEDVWKRLCERNGESYNPTKHYIIANKGGLLNPLNPKNNMVKILIQPHHIKERRNKEIIIEETGLIIRSDEEYWILTDGHNDDNKVDTEALLERIERELITLMDQTSKASKADTHIRKKIIGDSTFALSSTITPDLERRIGEIREEMDEDGRE